MNNTTIICSQSEVREILIPLLEKEFRVPNKIAAELFDQNLQGHLGRLKDSIYYLIESPYVDKVYRSCYAAYFALKRREYCRDCIRLSLFNGKVFWEDFRSQERIAKIAKQFMGFIVLRPIDPGLLGRSVLAPEALSVGGFLTLKAPFRVTANSVVFQVEGFPYSSQDCEITTCAETTLWAVMEYLSAKYNEFLPILPTTIIDTLRNYLPERQIPSNGLDVNQLSFALKQFGVESRIYSTDQFDSAQLKNILSTYVESGLPIIVVIDNSSAGGNIAHALLVVGHSKTTNLMIDNLTVATESDPSILQIILKRNIRFFDNDDLSRKFVFVDDNCPVYQLADLNAPADNYADIEWKKCEILSFIVPFFPKMYLEAVVAKSYFKEVLLNSSLGIPDNSSLVIRMYMSSSRSFKDSLAKDQSFPTLAKEYILSISMPRFIWIGEVSNKELIKNRQANGLFVFDATEPNTTSSKSLLAGLYQGMYYQKTFDVMNWSKYPSTFETFSIYNNNLNGY